MASAVVTFQFKNKLRSNLEKSMDKALDEYDSNDLVTKNVDDFQKTVSYRHLVTLIRFLALDPIVSLDQFND